MALLQRLLDHLPCARQVAPLRHELEITRDLDGSAVVRALHLEEHGGRPEQAEYIRLEVELAALPESDPRRSHFRERSAAIFRRYGREWFPFPVVLNEDSNSFTRHIRLTIEH